MLFGSQFRIKDGKRTGCSLSFDIRQTRNVKSKLTFCYLCSKKMYKSTALSASKYLQKYVDSLYFVYL